MLCRMGRHPASAARYVGFGRRRDGVLVIERQASPPGDCSSCVLLSNGPRVISSCGDHIGQGNPEKMGGRCMATGPCSYARLNLQQGGEHYWHLILAGSRIRLIRTRSRVHE